MRTPDFLIVGAMKSGTTTVFRDLETNPAIFFPLDKEPGNLCHDEVLAEPGRSEYLILFRAAKQSQHIGEASTDYTKLPDYPGVAQRTRELCGSDLRLIYVVREPISRIISHHYHFNYGGKIGPDINHEVRTYPALINYSRYAMQIQPWIEVFSEKNIMIARMEDYVRDRKGFSDRFADHIGVERLSEKINEDKVYNQSDGKPKYTGFWSTIYHAPIYRKVIRRFVPLGLKEWVFRTFMTKATQRPAPPTPETIDFILSELADDLREFASIMGQDEVWDMAAAREKHVAAYEAWKQKNTSS